MRIIRCLIVSGGSIVGKERLSAGRRVALTGRVCEERVKASGGVEAMVGVV